MLAGVPKAARVAREEIFGPVLSVVAFADLAEAVEITNATGYGLSAGVWSRDIDTALGYARATKAGHRLDQLLHGRLPRDLLRRLRRLRASAANSAGPPPTNTSSTRASIIRTGSPAPSWVGDRVRAEPTQSQKDTTAMYWNQRRVTERRTLPFSNATTAAARNAALEVAAGKVEAGSPPTIPDYFPLYTDQGRWKHGKEAWTNWCEGFLGGQMWIFYELGLGDDWQARAEHYTQLVEERQYDDQVHDLGFVLCPTWKKWWELTGDDTRARSSSKVARPWPPGSTPRASTCARSWHRIRSSSTS